MNKFEKFFGASSPLEIEGLILEVYPMSIEDSLLLATGKDESKDVILERRAKLIQKCLRDETLTIDDIKKFRQDIFLAILDKILEVSEEVTKTNDRALKRIKEQIARKQSEDGKSSDAPSD